MTPARGATAAGNINAILKSGTNTFHGDVYEFFRNTVLDANEYFLKGSGSPRPGDSTEYFWWQSGRAGESRRQARILLRELPGHAAAQRRFAGNADQHVYSVRAGGRSRRVAAAEANLANDFGVTTARSGGTSSCWRFRAISLAAPANGYLFPLPECAGRNDGGTLVQFTVSKPGKFTDDQFTANWDREFRRLAGHGGGAVLLFQFGAGHSVRRAAACRPRWERAASGTDLNFPYRCCRFTTAFSSSPRRMFSLRGW